MEINAFSFPPSKTPNLLHPLVLAYIGDAVYEAFVREYVVSLPNHRPNHMHRLATRFVSAVGQAKSLEALMDGLSQEELDVVLRGRNAKSGSVPKNADVLVYRHSTAFECLIGYLYYSKRFERLQELLRIAVDVHAADAGK
ncbi:Mini-ribonuclease 3 [Paenibacillus sp. MBLB4367]|uniref:Mini-ribonuclease 3 n=1 Tax=Paenibacillus sp. MBLB4367 TaxID=3384767 RepID=UPI00390842BF